MRPRWRRGRRPRGRRRSGPPPLRSRAHVSEISANDASSCLLGRSSCDDYPVAARAIHRRVRSVLLTPAAAPRDLADREDLGESEQAEGRVRRRGAASHADLGAGRPADLDDRARSRRSPSRPRGPRSRPRSPPSVRPCAGRPCSGRKLHGSETLFPTRLRRSRSSDRSPIASEPGQHPHLQAALRREGRHLADRHRAARAAASRRSRCSSIVATSFTSVWPKRLPMQIRWPPPKGT